MQLASVPDTLLLAHWAQALCGHGGEDGGDAWAPQHRLPLTEVYTAFPHQGIAQQFREKDLSYP